MVVKAGGSAAGIGSWDRPSAVPRSDPSDLFSAAIDDLTGRWARGEPVRAETYLSAGRGWPAERAVELVYREYRMAAEAGLEPSMSAYLERFPEHRGALERLLTLDAACPDSLLGRLGALDGDDDPLPIAGDAIGPYVLERELGEGAFARVFLARQADLADRPVVVKITTRPTREPWLLARARHPNIVEVLTHAEVDDGALQLIAMPFLGGASLAAVLARRRSRAAGGRASRFLEDLDAAAAPEFRHVGAPGPSRAILRATGDAGAFAWIAARLAEALDHASRRGVAHGDVKPSNVLVAADGAPMLLDFNLAQDWTGDDGADVGGTMAYMAPERLLALAGEGPSAVDDERAHRADVYSLGVVLLESLTGWLPSDGVAPGRGAGREELISAARAMTEARRRPAWLIRRAEAHAGRSLPAGLRAILRHCLAPDPSGRYARGLELAEDLDRWRVDRPLAFAPEPSRLHAVGRWARRRRRPLASAAAVLLAVGLVAWFALGNRSAQANLDRAAAHKYDQLVNLPDSRALHYEHPGEDFRRRRPAVIVADALRALGLYGVADDPAWRTRDDFARLPRHDRDDLEAWLLEQALRYGRALARRDDSPEDWLRARHVLDNAAGDAPPAAMAELRRRLTRRIGDGDAPPAPARPVDPALDAYLRGVSAEIDDDEAPGDVDVGARRAAGFHAEMLAIRPRSFWGRYRAAVVAYSLSRWDEAADGLRACLELRPENPVLHGLYASCLERLGRAEEALEWCDRGVALAPDHAELVQVRAFVRASGPSLDALKGDILRYERLRAALPDHFLREPDADGLPSIGRDLPMGPRRDGAPSQAIGEGVGPWELGARAVLASRILAGKPLDPDRPPTRSEAPDPRRLALAAQEVEKVLALDPSNFPARVERMCVAVRRGRPASAHRDLGIILDDPRLREYARDEPERIRALHYAASLFAHERDFVAALRLARKLVDLSLEYREPHARALYTLAAVEGYGAGYNPKWVSIAAAHLEQATRNNPKYEAWFRNDTLFDRARPQVKAAVDAIRAARSAPPPA
ncbi:protein kinase [Paludisphaera sp.]|uniref:protein kinase domain-containing protein n=1 Tax=Paludisphaera sp. TaxID=2017432 RepID=UPI00301CD5F3